MTRTDCCLRVNLSLIDLFACTPSSTLRQRASHPAQTSSQRPPVSPHLVRVPEEVDVVCGNAEGGASRHAEEVQEGAVAA